MCGKCKRKRGDGEKEWKKGDEKKGERREKKWGKGGEKGKGDEKGGEKKWERNVFWVTVGPKSKSNPFFGQGSTLGFMIDGVSGAPLHLKKGKTYTFHINTPGHPFYFTTSNTGGTGQPTGSIGGIMPVMKGTLVFHVPNNIPANFYYQCMLHPKMGSYVYIVSGCNCKSGGACHCKANGGACHCKDIPKPKCNCKSGGECHCKANGGACHCKDIPKPGCGCKNGGGKGNECGCKGNGGGCGCGKNLMAKYIR